MNFADVALTEPFSEWEKSLTTTRVTICKSNSISSIAMTTEQENKIIEQAQDIMARRFAVENELKLNAQSVAYYGAYYLGAIQAVQKVVSELTTNKPKGDDWVYLKAFWDCITKDKRHMQMYLDGDEMRYRNHVTAKNGKLKSVECYFVERRTLLTEKV